MRISDGSSDVCSADLRVEALGACGENLAAGLRDADRMLELRGQRPVARHRRPAVVQHLHIGTAAVDHRLYGEEHARLQTDAGALQPDMDDVRRIVENADTPVPAALTTPAVAVTFRSDSDGRHVVHPRVA